MLRLASSADKRDYVCWRMHHQLFEIMWCEFHHKTTSCKRYPIHIAVCPQTPKTTGLPSLWICFIRAPSISKLIARSVGWVNNGRLRRQDSSTESLRKGLPQVV